MPAYWLDVEAKVHAKLEALDAVLRRLWLECCGHLSVFRIGGLDYFSRGYEFGFARGLGGGTVERSTNVRLRDALPFQVGVSSTSTTSALPTARAACVSVDSGAGTHADALEELIDGCIGGHVSRFEHFNRMLEFVCHGDELPVAPHVRPFVTIAAVRHSQGRS